MSYKQIIYTCTNLTEVLVNLIYTFIEYVVDLKNSKSRLPNKVKLHFSPPIYYNSTSWSWRPSTHKLYITYGYNNLLLYQLTEILLYPGFSTDKLYIELVMYKKISSLYKQLYNIIHHNHRSPINEQAYEHLKRSIKYLDCHRYLRNPSIPKKSTGFKKYVSIDIIYRAKLYFNKVYITKSKKYKLYDYVNFPMYDEYNNHIGYYPFKPNYKLYNYYCTYIIQIDHLIVNSTSTCIQLQDEMLLTIFPGIIIKEIHIRSEPKPILIINPVYQ